MDAKEAAEQAAEQAVAPAGKKAARWVWVILGVLLVVIYAIPAAMTSSPKACGSCHAMKPYYESWQASSHRGVAPSCLYCHVRPGVVNAVAYRFLFYREILATITGRELKPIGAVAPSTESCVRAACHSMNRQVSNSGNLHINHRLHVDQAGIPCTKCHPGAVHKGVGGRLILPPSSICKECHEAKMSDCQYCHIGRPPTMPDDHSSSGQTSAAVEAQ